MSVKEQVSLPTQRICTRCNFVSSQEVCKACVLLEGLNKGLPKLGIGKSSKAKRMLEDYNARQNAGLEEAINEINDEFKQNNCVSKGKVCRSTCRGEKKVQSNELHAHTNNEIKDCPSVQHIEEEHKEDINTNCCDDNMCKCNKNEINVMLNSKANKLLAEYGIAEASTSEDSLIDKMNLAQEKGFTNELSSVNNSSNKKNATKFGNAKNDTEDFEVDLHTNDENVSNEEVETCAGACGKIDSLHIGF